jgi:hypothetical protein
VTIFSAGTSASGRIVEVMSSDTTGTVETASAATSERPFEPQVVPAEDGPREAAATASDGEKPPPAGPDDTREAIVKSTGSGYVPVRHRFVQKHDGKNRASTLGKLVRGRKRRELLLYLLVLTAWDDAKRSAWPAEVWLRALRVEDRPHLTWSRSTLSETWTELVRLKLVKRNREHRRSRITPKREDGKGEYTRPDGVREEDHYFTLPGVFWTELWFDRLSLPAIAVLLILLKETNKDKDEINLTYAETALWYGIGETSAKKGYQELKSEGLVDVRDEYRPSAYTEDGLTVKRFYRLTGEFSTKQRAAAREVADKERKKRLRQTKSKPAKKASPGVPATPSAS